MTDQEAFAAIMELNRKHKLGIEPDGWVYFESHKIHKDGWYKEICDPDFGTDVLPVTSPDRIDLQALTATATEWLEREHGVIIRRWLGGHAPFVDGEQNDRHTEHMPMHGRNYRRPTRLLAIHAAIEHVTEGSKA